MLSPTALLKSRHVAHGHLHAPPDVTSHPLEKRAVGNVKGITQKDYKKLLLTYLIPIPRQ